MKQRWIICFFGQAEHDHFWWRVFTRNRPNHAHCIALRCDATLKVWHYLEWSRAGLVNTVMSREEAVPLISQMMQIATCWEYEVEYNALRRRFPPLCLYCVSVIKELLGIIDYRVWTPYQLERWLIRNGAKRVFHDEQT